MSDYLKKIVEEERNIDDCLCKLVDLSISFSVIGNDKLSLKILDIHNKISSSFKNVKKAVFEDNDEQYKKAQKGVADTLKALSKGR